jgi:hypothetical protein
MPRMARLIMPLMLGSSSASKRFVMASTQMTNDPAMMMVPDGGRNGKRDHDGDDGLWCP